MKRILTVAAGAAFTFALAPSAYAVDYCVGTTRTPTTLPTDNFGSGSSPASGPECSNVGSVDQNLQDLTNGGHFDITAFGGSVFSGPISASIGHDVITTAATNAVDRFIFTIPQTGLGSGSVVSNTFSIGSAQDLDFVSVVFNNGFQNFFATIDNSGLGSTATIQTAVPIFAGVQNILTITYSTKSTTGSVATKYDGNLSFNPVPEPATWALMLAGFGAIGFAMRRQRKAQPQVRFAF